MPRRSSTAGLYLLWNMKLDHARLSDPFHWGQWAVAEAKEGNLIQVDSFSLVIQWQNVQGRTYVEFQSLNLRSFSITLSWNLDPSLKSSPRFEAVRWMMPDGRKNLMMPHQPEGSRYGSDSSTSSSHVSFMLGAFWGRSWLEFNVKWDKSN